MLELCSFVGGEVSQVWGLREFKASFSEGPVLGNALDQDWSGLPHHLYCSHYRQYRAPCGPPGDSQ